MLLDNITRQLILSGSAAWRLDAMSAGAFLALSLPVFVASTMITGDCKALSFRTLYDDTDVLTGNIRRASTNSSTSVSVKLLWMRRVNIDHCCSVRSASRREFRTSRKARDSSSSPACLTIWVKTTVRLNLLYISTPIISDCFVMLLDIGMYSALPITGGSCAKSPQMMTFTPPNGRWLYSGKASQQREWRIPSICRDTIDFSSIMMYRMSLNSTCILLRWLAPMASSGFPGEMWKSRWRVYPLILCEATPVGAHRTTGSPRPLLAANWAKCDDTISIK